jgi:hypothetical protein
LGLPSNVPVEPKTVLTLTHKLEGLVELRGCYKFTAVSKKRLLFESKGVDGPKSMSGNIGTTQT